MNRRSMLGLLAGALVALGARTAAAQVTGNDAIMVINWQSDHTTDVFVQTFAGDMLNAYSAQPAPSDAGATDTWTPLTLISKGATCGAAALWLPTAQVGEVYDPAPQGGAQHTYWTGTTWATLQPFGGGGTFQVSHLSALFWPSSGMNGPKKVERQIFGLGIDHGLHSLSLGLNALVWGSWTSIGTPANLVTGAGVLLWPDGHAEIFATDASGTVWHFWTTGTDSTTFGQNVSSILGTARIASRPVPVLPSNGVPQVLARGSDQQLYVSTFAGGAFQPFSVVSPGTMLQGEPSAIANGPGIEVFARNTDGIVVHLGPNATTFTALFEQPAASDPFVSVRSDGSADVFVIDPSGVLQHSFRPASGTWTAWTPLGGQGLNPCVLQAPPSPTDAGADAAGTGGAGPSPTGSGGPGGAGGHGGAANAGGAGGSAGTDDGGGCGCRAARSSDAGAAWLAAAALGLIARRRRRD